MQVNRKRDGRRRLPSAVLVFLSVVFLGGVSFGGALLWQRADQAALAREEALPAMVATSSAGAGEGGPPTPGEGLPARQTIPLSPEPADEPPPSEPELQPGLFAVDWQVPPAPPVDLVYFYDALFLGDTLATGLIAHRLAGRGDVLAAIGITPGEAIALLEESAGPGEKGKVYLMFGMDSLSLEAGDFLDEYRSLIAAVREGHPAAAIYIVNIPPVGAGRPGITAERVAERNAAIAQLARENRLHLLNVFEGLAQPAGSLPAHASRDGLHLSAEYYFLLFEYLKGHTVGG